MTSLAQRRMIVALGASALLWTFGAIAIQAGPRMFALAVLVTGGIVLLAAGVFGLIKAGMVSIVTVAVVPLALWWWLWGSYSITRDMLGGGFAVTLAWVAARLWSQWLEKRRGTGTFAQETTRRKRRRVRRFLVLSFLFIWVINSTLDAIFESRTLPRSNEPLRLARGDTASWPAVRVGVALSGGGYRGAIMHAGVLAELDAMRVPVTNLSCVSGGSIIGSFYATGGAPDAFRDAVVAGRMNLMRDMADFHNAVRLPFPLRIPYLQVELLPWLSFGRVDVQANLVDRVFLGSTTLADMREAGPPYLQICTTDLRLGMSVGLAADGVAIRTAPHPAHRTAGRKLLYEVHSEFHSAVDQEIRLADLVAASGAFPGAFSAVRMTLPATDTQPARPLLLADGGIMDNWGVGLMLDRHRAAEPDGPWRLDVLLISAGGRIFEEGEVAIPEELRRAIDIVYETAGWRPVELVRGSDRPPIVLLQPADLDPQLPEYRAFVEASTLVDQYSSEQAQKIFNLGRQLVRNAADDLTTYLNAAQAARTGQQ